MTDLEDDKKDVDSIFFPFQSLWLPFFLCGPF
jgi:hypothetical protein